MYSSFISTLSIIVSLSTLSGILLHDTRLDKVTAVAAVPPSVLAHYESINKAVHFGDSHTHVERSSFSQAMRSYQTSTPGLQPRSESRKHLMQSRIPKGHHTFDNYNMPIM